jgi:hypothetical protein
MANTKTVSRTLALVGFNLVVALVLLEGVLLVLLHVRRVTAWSPPSVRALAQQVYRHFVRNLVQFDESCARYDPVVTYTLKPGTCTFDNLEFTTELHVNRLGLRDGNDALAGPEVIVLGDSHAMGWGVGQEEAFPRVAARKTGLNILNAAVSSYGTVREMLLLDRLDRSRLRALVIQYSDNDIVENAAFRANANHLPITPQPRYQEFVRYYRSQRAYFPGKYVFRLFLKISRLETPEPDSLAFSPTSPDEEVALFVNALGHAGHTPLEGVRLIVLEVGQDFAHPRAFISALADWSRRPDTAAFYQQLVTLDTTTIIRSEDFYILDDHMTARGHERLGEALGELLTRLVR